MIAVDSSVLFDVLIGDPQFAGASETCIGDALARDDVVVCEAVVAEVQSMLDTSVNLMDTLSQLGIRYDPVGEAAAMRAIRGRELRIADQHVEQHGGVDRDHWSRGSLGARPRMARMASSVLV